MISVMKDEYEQILILPRNDNNVCNSVSFLSNIVC
jgi:hypothetical protein